MKALTCVSPLTELKREVISAWSLAAGDNWKYSEDKEWRKPQSIHGANLDIIDIVKSINSDNSFTVKYCEHLKFRSAGFVQFYNDYYKLTQPKLTKEQFLNCKLIVPTEEISKAVQVKLQSLGFMRMTSTNNGIVLRARKLFIRTNTITYSPEADYEAYPDYKVITYQDILGYEVEAQPDYSNVKVYCPTEEIWNKVQTKFWELGWLFDTDKPVALQKTYPYSSGPWLGTELYGTSKTKQLQIMSTSYVENHAKERRLVDYTELLHPQQPLIKQSINNLIPQTYDKGQSIIIPAKVASITRGQTISGHFTPGRKRRATIKVGHLSYGRISG